MNLTGRAYKAGTGAQSAPTFMALACRVEEPSTASQADIAPAAQNDEDSFLCSVQPLD